MAVDGASTLAAITMALGKYRVAHSTTVAIVPPEHLWPPIQAARERLRDGGLTRWPPHVNLIYPFVEPPYFERFAERFAPAVAQCAPFRVRLERLGVFGSSRRGVVWLDPVVVGAADGERPPSVQALRSSLTVEQLADHYKREETAIGRVRR